ncbi:MAG: LysR family transcriptional regulator, partial [Mesorhizobium sp.]
LLTLVMVAQSDAIAPVSIQVAKFIQSPEGLSGAIDIIPTEFDIEVRPYSLITVKNRVLSPAAKMLHDFILREVG